MTKRKTLDIADIFFVIFLFTLSIGIHYFYVKYMTVNIDDPLGLYEIASIKKLGIIPYLPHGASYLYACLLNNIFYVIGNKIQAAIVLQIVLKMLGFAFLFLSLRLSIGKAGALVSTAFLLFLPVNYTLLSKMTPSILAVFFVSIQLFILTQLIVKNRQKMLESGRNLMLFLLYGIICAITVWLDILGMILLLLSYFFLVSDTIPMKKKVRPAIVRQLLLMTAGFSVAAVLLFGGIGICFQIGFLKSVQNYFTQYIFKIGSQDYFYAELILCSFLGGILIQWILEFIKSKLPKKTSVLQVDEDQEPIPLSLPLPNGLPLPAPEEKTKYIPLDNPLPLPTKFPKKDMDFAYEPDPNEMRYDYETTKEDDFDIH